MHGRYPEEGIDRRDVILPETRPAKSPQARRRTAHRCTRAVHRRGVRLRGREGFAVRTVIAHRAKRAEHTVHALERRGTE
jgi:hypothetical protein